MPELVFTRSGPTVDGFHLKVLGVMLLAHLSWVFQREINKGNRRLALTLTQFDTIPNMLFGLMSNGPMRQICVACIGAYFPHLDA